MIMADVDTGDSKLDAKVQEWLAWDKNEKTRSEILELVQSRKIDDLKSRLFSRMAFGTAGLRARMGAGNSMMNDLTIIQATQGVIRYLKATCPEATQKGMVIGYDARYNSHRFASLTATIAISEDIPVYLFSKITPTPFVAYGVLHYGCSCGVMVTASHNPKEDNGYKVYWGNGAQIIPPVDEGISKEISENLEPWPSSWDISILDSSPSRKDPYDEVYAHYMEDVKKLNYYRDQNTVTPLKFTYTAMHGVGYQFTTDALKQFGFCEPIPVKEQVEPDPEFPTVKYPNPEEGKGALSLSMQTADANNSTVILANDPDADRLAVAEKLPSGEWKIFTGNQIGALLGWWSWYSYKESHPETADSDIYMLASTVSSKILKTIAIKEGFNFEETLTGFKWMGNISHNLQKEGKVVLFAFEEAIGFMCGTSVLDKDGVSAAAVTAELATHLSKINLTLTQKLEEIYTTYGYHITDNSYYICHNPDTIKLMFENIRNYNQTGKYPEAFGKYKIKYIRDLTTGYDNSRPDGKTNLPVNASSQMITITFENGCVATIRTSGTEPKIKYYTEHCSSPDEGLDSDAARNELEDIVKAIIEHFYQPKKYGLIARTS